MKPCLLFSIIILVSSSSLYIGEDFKNRIKEEKREKAWEEFESSPSGLSAKKAYISSITRNSKITDSVLKWSLVRGISEYLILAIIQKESQFCIWARGSNSESFDQGLMQLNSLYYKDESLNYYDIDTNIELGSLHLYQVLKQFENLEQAIQAYNCGSSRVWKNKIPDSTVSYSKQVLGYYGEFKKGFRKWLVGYNPF